MRRHWINAINVLAPSLVFMAFANVAHAQKAPPELAKFFDYTKAATVPATGGNVVRKAKCCDVAEKLGQVGRCFLSMSHVGEGHKN